MGYMIIDGNSIINRAFYATPPLTNSKGVYTNAVYGFLNIYLKFLSEENPDGVAVAFDLRAPTFRHKMFDGYKAGRKGMPEELASQMPILKDVLKKMGITCLEKEGYEADDILGTLSRMCAEKGKKCTIITGDRDSFQLINDFVTVKLPSTKKGHTETIIYNVAKINEDYNLNPIDMIEVKALMGDGSDNIPGVAGVGEKTALKLISDYKTLEGIYENIDNIKGSLKEKLQKDKDMAFLSRTLGTINKEVPLDIELSALDLKEYDKDELFETFSYLEFKNLITKLGLTKSKEKVESEEIIPEEKETDFILSEAKKEGKIYLYLKNGELFCYVNSGYKAKGDFITFLTEIISDKEIKKYFANYKEILSICYNGEEENIVFDGETAGYVLNSAASDYSLKALILNYLEKDIINESSMIFYLPALCEIMTEKIEFLGLSKVYYDIDMPLIPCLISMEKEGFKVDREELCRFGEMLKERIEETQNKIYELSGEEFNINSPKQLGIILFEKLNLPVIKKTKTGYSTNAEVLEELAPMSEVVSYILEYRQLTKLNSTYVEGLLAVLDENDIIHSSFNQTVTATGRLSSTEPNLQNIPVRYALGREMRKMFIPHSKENILIDGDYSQIELRVLSHMADDENMTAAFKSGADIHRMTASQVFNTPFEEVTDTQRSSAKAVNFGIVYGIGAFSLSKDLKISMKEAKNYIQSYFETYPGVKSFLDNIVAEAEKTGYIKTMVGRIRYIPEILSSNKVLQGFGKRAAMNSPVQGSAADIIKIAMIKVFERLKKENMKTKLILQVHDELILDAPLEEKEKAEKILKEEMENAVNLRVDLLVDVNFGENWYIAKG
ncbi:MAG: DNA polymerase I [Clostridia bacterium]|nr:DNA polymerase I [Clostridia bacterium]